MTTQPPPMTNIMNKLCILILQIPLFTSSGNCQSIMNGDFEINSATTCQFNLYDTFYNGFMSNSWGFGGNTYSGLDIQTIGCGYAIPPSNLWFVSLSKNGVGGTGTFAISDAISLKIDTPLIAGLMYQLSYYEFASDTFGNPITELEIGLSMDSLNFGQLIYASIPPLNSWIQRTFTFIAPIDGKYITVRNDLNGNDSVFTALGWNSIDRFEITLNTGIIENNQNNTCNLFPNPFNDVLNIRCKKNAASEIILYDVSSKILIHQVFTNEITINTTLLSAGIYFYEIRSNDGSIKKGKAIKE